MSAGGSSMYSQSGMTESPKPLSPGAAQANQPGHDGSSSIARQRSPSHTSQFQQQHFGHRQSDRHTPPGLSLPSPLASAKLPGVSGFAAPPYPAQSAMAAAALAGAGHSTRAQQQQQPHSAGSDGPYSNTMAYIQSLEAKVEAHAAKIHELEAQVAKIHELEEVVASLVQSKADANAFQKKTEAQAEAVVAATQA